MLPRPTPTATVEREPEVPSYLASLNPQQRAAVEHGVPSHEFGAGAAVPIDRGPLLVIAGAGSGKTSTLACRAAHLIANGADPQRIAQLGRSHPTVPPEERQNLLACLALLAMV